MNTKIIIISAIILLLIAGGIFFYLKTDRAEEGDDILGLLDFEALSFSDVDLYLSDLRSSSLPEIDLGSGLGFDAPDVQVGAIAEIGQVPVPDISFDASVFDVSAPQISIPQMPSHQPGPDSGQAAPPGSWEPNSSDCSAFASAPDCSFVPAANRDMCEQCKAAGY